MPDPYFDVAEAYASDYLPSSALDDPDIDFFVKQAERDVIAHYTRTNVTTPMMATTALLDEDGAEHLLDADTDRAVYLRYYHADAAEVDTSNENEVDFLEAMRATIAEVAMHRIDVQDQVSGVKREQRGRREIEYFDDRDAFPSQWTRYLKPFDIRPPTTYT